MKVLAVGAHPDDIELGCGGALRAHYQRGDQIAMLVMTTGEQGPQAARSRVAEQEDAARQIVATLHWGGFQDGAVPAGARAVAVLEAVVREEGPDVIYTHLPTDSHQDHRATALASLSACRRFSRVLMYESPTTLNFNPLVFVDVSEHLEGKLDLIRAHMSQVLKNGLVDVEAVEAQARFRGFQARVRQAEAFEAARFLWDVSVGSADESMAGRHDLRPAGV